MGEIKSVKVDNWGVFFLQKLQNFFNKTDYCDLTLQFRDNSQLKVHRLVLSACTDYFNVLEQTCEVVDDAIIMPNGLQADVVVPIVNFMYTGTLEFELKMYNRLLRTAKDMNMTVLLKLLEAHRRTMEMHPPKATGQAIPTKNRRKAQAAMVTGNLPGSTGGRSLIQTNQGNKRIVVGSSVKTQQNRIVSTSNVATRPLPVGQIGSTTFTRIKVENEQQEINLPVSSSSGYSLIKQSTQLRPQQPTSPFEQLRKGYNNKRPAVTSFVSPPAKKPNLEDVKEFAEQQRMRKQIAAEYGDDDYDASNIMDDDTIHNDDDDDDMTSSGQTQTLHTTATSTSAAVQTVASSSSQQSQSEDPPGTTTIIVKHEGPDKPPTIVVKDNSNSKMNHAKIISEVLRQYPHLVKSNKNIKLKIMPNAGGQAQKIVVKKETVELEKQMQPPANKPTIAGKLPEQKSAKTLASNIISNRPKTTPQQKPEVPLSAKTIMSGAETSVSKPIVGSSTASTQSGGQTQKRRIDSKTMHALIALGAENTTGPWLCLRCGRNGHPISIPSYRGFRRHLINTHKETIDPALCEHCGWRSAGKRELHFHMQLEHKIRNNLYIFPECQLCQQMCIDSDGLNQHLIDSHPDENKQQCIYCNKIFPEELQLYTHMKTFHKKQALEDGIIDYSDDENQTQMTLPPLSPLEYDQEMEQEQKDDQEQKKIKILSDISLPIASSIIKTESFAQQTSAAEEYLQDQEHEEDNTETKFVAADGSEVILTAEQRKEILSQLNQEHEGSGVVMVLSEEQQQQQQYPGCEIQSDQGVISQDENSQTTTATNEERVEEEEEHVAEEDDQHDDNQIYNEMKSLQSNLDDSTTQSEAEGKQEISQHEEERHHEPEGGETDMDNDERTEHLEESKESMDNLEWAENLISEHDLADDISSQAEKETKLEEKEEIKEDDNKSQDEISKKLKELTGDWSDDDDEDMPEEKPVTEIAPIQEAGVKSEASTAEDAEMKEAEKTETEEISKEKEENPEFEDHAELLASLQSTEKDEALNEKANLVTDKDECENIDEDDIDMALKSLHKEDEGNESTAINKTEEEKLDESEEKGEATKNTVPEAKETVKIKDEKEMSSSEPKKDIEADEEKPEEKLVKELETIDEPEVTSSAMEVDEEMKKDLIESLLNEKAETMENTATETPALAAETIKSETDKIEEEFQSSPSDENDKEESVVPVKDDANLDDSKTLLSNNEEFLDSTPEKKETSSDNTDTPINVTATSKSEADETETTEVAAVSSTKEENTISSEDRVKNLISEWGDDDEDEDDIDADLTANL